MLLRSVSPELRPRDLRELAQRSVDEVKVREEGHDVRLFQLVAATLHYTCQAAAGVCQASRDFNPWATSVWFQTVPEPFCDSGAF